MEKVIDEHREHERSPARCAPEGPADIHPTLTNGTNLTSTDKESFGYATSTTGGDHRSETAKAERRLLFKLGLSGPKPLADVLSMMLTFFGFIYF